MRISEKLHLVVPIYDGDDKIHAYAHSTPISREVFEAHFMLISQTFTAVYGDGLGTLAGPRVASLLLSEVAKTNGRVNEANSLKNEIRRLTNVLFSTPAGWETIPFDQAGSLDIDPADLAEIENAIVFFTVTSSMHRRKILMGIMSGAASLWGAEISSLDFLAFAASLKTSTVAATGPKATPGSSVPF